MKTATQPSVINPVVVILALLAAAVVFLGWKGTTLPLLSSPKASLAIVLLLGMAICAQGGIGRVAAAGHSSIILLAIVLLLTPLTTAAAAPATAGQIDLAALNAAVEAQMCKYGLPGVAVAVICRYSAVQWVEPWPQSNHSTFALRGVPALPSVPAAPLRWRISPMIRLNRSA